MIPAAFESVGLTLGMIVLTSLVGLVALVIVGSWVAGFVYYVSAKRREAARDRVRTEKDKRFRAETAGMSAHESHIYGIRHNYGLDYARSFEREDPAEGFFLAAWTSGIALVIGLIFGLAGGAPFQSQYWQQYRVEGTIVEASNTFTDASGDVTTTPVVVLDSVPDPLYADQARLTTMKGERVSLLCVAEWHFRSAPTYVCRLESVLDGAR